jgi:hypothetical protein
LANATNVIHACARRSSRTVQGYFLFYAQHQLSGPAYRRLRAVTVTKGSERTILTQRIWLLKWKKDPRYVTQINSLSSNLNKINYVHFTAKWNIKIYINLTFEDIQINIFISNFLD